MKRIRTKAYPPTDVELHNLLLDTVWLFRGVRIYHTGVGQIAIIITLSYLTLFTLGIYSYFVRRKVRKELVDWKAAGVSIWRIDTVPI